jgi:hypothetical protein
MLRVLGMDDDESFKQVLKPGDRVVGIQAHKLDKYNHYINMQLIIMGPQWLNINLFKFV